MIPARAAQNRGMTLIEILVALVIFSTALFAVMKCLSRVVHASRINHEYEVAALLVERVLGEAELEGVLSYEDESGDFGEAYADFRWESDVQSTDASDLYEVTVTVTWDSFGASRSWGLTTYLYDSGV